MKSPSIISSIWLCIALGSNACAQSAIVSPAGGDQVVAGAVGTDNLSKWDLQTGATDIRTKDQRSVSQGGRTCAARPYGRSDRYSYQRSAFGVTRGTQIDLANNFEGISTWTDYGRNNLYVSPAPLYSAWTIINGGNIGAIDNNWWGTGIVPTTPGGTCSPYCIWSSNPSDLEDAQDITYTCSSSLGAYSSFSDVSCDESLGYVAHKNKGARPQALDSISTCRRELNQGTIFMNDNQCPQAYDILEAYVDTCYEDALSYSAFEEMSSAEQCLEVNDSSMRETYRYWLESVLYLNTTNPEYFCQCVEALSGTFRDSNSWFAVTRWLVLNTTCDTPYLWTQYEGGRQSQFSTWQTENTGQPLDTSLPSLRQLGIDTLLARHWLYAGVSEQPQSILLSATASPNPVTPGTIITFGLSQEAYVKINLFDILGKPVAGSGVRGPGSGGEGFEDLFEPGNHEVPLSLQGLPSGTYYARILTAFGSVATVKLVKEQ